PNANRHPDTVHLSLRRDTGSGTTCKDEAPQ
ncbi:uncharacterized protein METZ01_LOCUS93444, partial [marine metagenome]